MLSQFRRELFSRPGGSFVHGQPRDEPRPEHRDNGLTVFLLDRFGFQELADSFRFLMLRTVYRVLKNGDSAQRRRLKWGQGEPPGARPREAGRKRLTAKPREATTARRP